MGPAQNLPRLTVDVLPTAQVPVCDGKGSPYLHFELQARLWRQVANLDPSERAAALILRMVAVARQVGPPAGGDFVVNDGGAERILNILKDYLAPDAANSIYREVVRPFHLKRPNLTMDVRFVFFFLSRL